jgi:hypothetical protein
MQQLKTSPNHAGRRHSIICRLASLLGRVRVGFDTLVWYWVELGPSHIGRYVAAVPFTLVVQWAAGHMPAWWARLREQDHLRAITVGQLAPARGVDGAATPRENETLV